MGHVDHGKTTLLDTLRKSRIAAKEAGGITQKTSAYSVPTKSGASVTFLDTPGHKAFTEMRARGASLTDVAVLVVAADDGVMEQTQEAIDHASAADVPMVVCINKCDRNNADPMKVRQQLASAGVLVEDYGGEVGVVECSATTGDGLDALVERLALETELLELSADPSVPARGVVIDSTKDSKLGVVTTIVVESGTLRAKDPILAGTTVGRVRWLLDDRGKRVTEAGPSMPVQVVGFDEPPRAGVRFMAVADINMARNVAAERTENAKVEAQIAPASEAVTLENLFETIESQAVTEINVLLKADNMGSVDVVKQTVEDVTHPEVRFKVLRSGVGGITEDDVLLASASDAFIIGFGVVPDTRARAAVQRTGVDVKFYDVIYEMTDDLEKALEGELGTETHEEIIGHATVRAIFKASKYGNIAGCYVTDGILSRDCGVRLVRDGKVVHTGRLDSLKRFKDDVKEVRENYECGLHLHNYNDIKEEDVLEAFTVTEVKRTLESTKSES
jgi:translation initiation factor IF-2